MVLYLFLPDKSNKTCLKIVTLIVIKKKLETPKYFQPKSSYFVSDVIYFIYLFIVI